MDDMLKLRRTARPTNQRAANPADHPPRPPGWSLSEAFRDLRGFLCKALFGDTYPTEDPRRARAEALLRRAYENGLRDGHNTLDLPKVTNHPVLVAAVDRAVNGPSAEEVIAKKLGSLAGIDCIEDTEKTLVMLYATWGREIAKALREAGLLS